MSINRQSLIHLTRTDSLAESFFRYLIGHYENNMTELKVERTARRLQKGDWHDDKVSKRSLVRLFKQLEELGCGRHVSGKNSRFVWKKKNMLDVARIALGEEDEDFFDDELDLENADFDGFDDFLEEEAESTDAELLSHAYVLRKALTLEFDLPADLSHEEASRLGYFVKALAWNEAGEQEASSVEYHELRLREDVTVELELPVNLQYLEADRLSAFFDTLPLEAWS